MARLSVSAKIFTLDACVVQMMLATMILSTVTIKNYTELYLLYPTDLRLW